jgi:hypothetical protein
MNGYSRLAVVDSEQLGFATVSILVWRNQVHDYFPSDASEWRVKSGLLFGVSEDAAHVASHIVNRERSELPLWNSFDQAYNEDKAVQHE